MGLFGIISIAFNKSSFTSTEKLVPLEIKVPRFKFISSALNNYLPSIFSRYAIFELANVFNAFGKKETIDKSL